MRSKVAAIITVFLFGVGLLVFIMVQMQNYASIINDAGSVRGATQRAVKLEIAGLPNEDVVERVDEVLASLIDRFLRDNEAVERGELFAYMGFPENWKDVARYRM